MALTQHQRQRATGFMFAVLAVVMIGVSVVRFSGGNTPASLFTLSISGFLGYLSWRQLQPGRSEPLPTADERTQQIVQLAGNQALWILTTVMFLQLAFDVIPDDLVTSSYILVGMIAFGIFRVYYRRRGPAR